MLEKRMKKESLFFCPTATPSSKNGKIWTGSRFIPSKATTLWRKETRSWWEDNRALFTDELAGLEKPYVIGLHFVRKSKHQWDFVNPVQTVQDEAVAYGFFIDDNCDEMIPVPLMLDGKWYSYDKDNSGVYIKIIKGKELKAVNLALTLNIKK